jgi:ribonuclease P protein component
MLTRHQRITTSADYARLFADAPSGHSPLMTVKAKPATASRAGIIVSKRTAPLAVDRNRIKRRLRASLRQDLAERPNPCELVVIAKAPARRADSASLMTDFQKALAAALKKAA